MTLSKGFYFAFFGAGASLSPFLALYYQSLGLGGEQIGLLRAIPSLFTLLVAPVWAGLADATHQHKRLLVLAMSGTLSMAGLMYLARSFWGLVPVVMLYAVFAAPVMSLVDSSVVAMLKGERARYGRLRLWGAVGWGIMGPLVGVLVERYSLGWAFTATGCCGRRPAAGGRHAHSGGPAEASYWSGFRQLARNRGWLLFLTTMFLFTAGRSTLDGFLFLHLDAIGCLKLDGLFAGRGLAERAAHLLLV